MQVPVYAYIFKLKSLQVDTNNRKKKKLRSQRIINSVTPRPNYSDRQIRWETTMHQ